MYLANHVNGDFIPGVKKIKTDGPEWKEVREDVEQTLRAVRGVLGWMADLCRRYNEGVGFVGKDGRIEAVRLEKGRVYRLSDEALRRVNRGEFSG